jgi:hypothetical protein
MTAEEAEEQRRKREDGGSYQGDYWVPGSTTGTAAAQPGTTTTRPKPPAAVPGPGGGAGTSYGVGLDSKVAPAPLPPPPVIQPYTSDSSAETIRAAVDPARTGGGNTQFSPPPPPAPVVTTPPNPLTDPNTRKTEVPKVVTTTVVKPPTAEESEFKRLQRMAADEIQKTLEGKTPSLATLQQRAMFDKAIATQAALAAGARGRSVASAARTQANNTGTLQMQAADAGAQLRAQEIADARKELASLATAGRGQDINEDQFEAGLDVDIQKFNSTQLQNASAQDAENYLKALGLDDAYIKSVKDQWLAYQQLGMTDAIERLKIATSLELAKMAKTKDGWDKLLAIGGFIGNVGEGVGAIVGSMDPKPSDRRVKVKVMKIEGPALDEFLNATRSAFDWKYKDPEKHGKGRHQGPMAQDIMKSRLGRMAVLKDEEGVLNLDFRRLAALALMGLGRLDARMSKLEGKE